MVRIRLKRMGRTHRPYYRIEVMDQRAMRDGRTIENVGHYDPLEGDEAKKVTLAVDRIQYWLSVGAKPSETVASFLRHQGIRWGITPQKRLERNRKSKVRKKGPSKPAAGSPGGSKAAPAGTGNK